MRIIDKLKKLNAGEVGSGSFPGNAGHGDPASSVGVVGGGGDNGSRHLSFSFEFFPPKTQGGVNNLYVRMDRMAAMEPLWVCVTWNSSAKSKQTRKSADEAEGDGDVTLSGAQLRTLDIVGNAQKYCGVDVMMHITCTQLTRSVTREILAKAKEKGIHNVLALRGDPIRGTKWSQCEGGFANATELVRFIRSEFGSHFCIGVSGYPEGWKGEETYRHDLEVLREKVRAGADIVLTQMFYDSSKYSQFVRDARELGITVPIIPGIMPIQSFKAFLSMTKYCRCRVPEDVMSSLREVKDDDEAVRSLGVDIMVNLCRKCLDDGAPSLHFYTLNLEGSVRNIIGRLQSSPLNVTGTSSGQNSQQQEQQKQQRVQARNPSRRRLPWRASTLPGREKEDVRPIFWANRPKSYLSRTETWDEFPNGRWGNADSPAFGQLAENSHFFSFYSGTAEERRAQWGEGTEIQDFSDVYEVFARYVEGKVTRLPWCEEPLQLETLSLVEKLSSYNRNGFLTINSQPAVNGAPSEHPVFGWGGPGGRIYQKAYVEFFTSAANLALIMERLDSGGAASGAPATRYDGIVFHAIDSAGNSYTNCTTRSTNAVTWGVFPGKEVLQPTIVDPAAFMVWKDEAFSLWLEIWASIYRDDSPAADVIHRIHDGYYLVNIVDNDFMSENRIFRLFEETIASSVAKVPGEVPSSPAAGSYSPPSPAAPPSLRKLMSSNFMLPSSSATLLSEN